MSFILQIIYWYIFDCAGVKRMHSPSNGCDCVIFACLCSEEQHAAAVRRSSDVPEPKKVPGIEYWVHFFLPPWLINPFQNTDSTQIHKLLLHTLNTLRCSLHNQWYRLVYYSVLNISVSRNENKWLKYILIYRLRISK